MANGEVLFSHFCLFYHLSNLGSLSVFGKVRCVQNQTSPPFFFTKEKTRNLTWCNNNRNRNEIENVYGFRGLIINVL